MSDVQPSTPPHHPTHNVRFDPSLIASIVRKSLPDHKLHDVQQLASGKSFNNRIYFLTTRKIEKDTTPNSNLSGTSEIEHLALKVSGKFFGPDKVQNEVSCLLLLGKYCPSIPAPRVIAWSDDGKRMSTAVCHPGSTISALQTSNIPDLETRGRGFILMTRRPGRVLSEADLEGPRGDDLMKHLAGYVSKWSLQLPASRWIGNIKLVTTDHEHTNSNIYETVLPGTLAMQVEGLIIRPGVPAIPIETPLDYLQLTLADQLRKLKTEPVFSSTRNRLAPILHRFIQTTLPNLPLFSTTTPNRITFTHYDLSPRNILVSTSTSTSSASSYTTLPRISGILDFEFAGFFPTTEDFANTAVNDAENWPTRSYEVFLTELERLGLATPLRGFDAGMWEEARRLFQLTEYIAPWDIHEDGVERYEVEEQLRGAAEKVVAAVDWLSARVEGG